MTSSTSWRFSISPRSFVSLFSFTIRPKHTSPTTCYQQNLRNHLRIAPRPRSTSIHRCQVIDVPTIQTSTAARRSLANLKMFSRTIRAASRRALATPIRPAILAAPRQLVPAANVGATRSYHEKVLDQYVQSSIPSASPMRSRRTPLSNSTSI